MPLRRLQIRKCTLRAPFAQGAPLPIVGPSIIDKPAMNIKRACTHSTAMAVELLQRPWKNPSRSHRPITRLPMPERTTPVAINAIEAPLRIKPTSYPEPFASRMAGREKRPLGDLFGLTNFGVNLTRLAPAAVSSLRHAHSRQDEFIYVLQGRPTLHTDEGRTQLSPGMCAGFKAGTGNGHRLINDTAEDVVYLEVGDRTPGDEGTYPDDDLKALLVEGKWNFVHKDGRPY
jgi:uncharacterized cupin superfamily protein